MEQCRTARECLDAIDWPCRILTNFSDTNLGCGIRIHTAISWALEQYDNVIVLEDDCIPHSAFFPYCAELLSYYQDDERIMHISGNNFRGPAPAGDFSYYFSKYTHAWGWATWRRAWSHFDWHMSSWPQAKATGLIENWCDDPFERAYWTGVFDKMELGAKDIWDYQWNFACWSQGGFTVIPRVNLVSNIGAGADATHSVEPGHWFNRPTTDIGPIRHPPFVIRHHQADASTFDANFGGGDIRRAASLSAKLRARLEVIAQPLRLARNAVRHGMSTVRGGSQR